MDLKELLKDKGYRRIVKFFHENPGSIDTERGVAIWTSQDIKKVRPALHKLASHGVLIAHKASSTIAYSYTRNKSKALMIARILAQYK